MSKLRAIVNPSLSNRYENSVIEKSIVSDTKEDINSTQRM